MSAKISFRAHFARHARHFSSEAIELVHHRVDGVLELKNFSLYVHGNFPGKVAFRDSRRHLGDVTNLGREISGHGIHGICEVFPCSCDAGNVRLTAQSAFASNFTRHARHFSGEAIELVDHGV